MDKSRKNRIIIPVCIFILVLLLAALPFLTVFIIGTATPPQYGDTYYGELAVLYDRLKNTSGKKIVIIGNSGVPFGVDSALCERLLSEAGEEYSVCNFGLYGALGTKMMLDLALDEIGENDIVVFAPELAAQPLSLYFSAREAWYAADSDLDLFFKLNDERGAMAGSFFGYASKKYDLYRKGEPAKPSGIYAKASFDGHCDLKNYDRPYNVMPDGLDADNPIVLDASIYADDFVAYVNAYYKKISARGAQMYYAFPPLNRKAIQDGSEEIVEQFYESVRAKFDFPVMNDISACIMDSEWFYDSNFHLNEAGMIVHTVDLVNDLKNQFGNGTPTEIVLPEKPVTPQVGVDGEGDNSDREYFLYEREGNYYVITSLTEAGKSRKELVIPYKVDGLYIKAFLPEVFAGNATVESITVQENIRNISDNSFYGCTGLKKIILKHTSPDRAVISVGSGLLNGTSAAIFVPKDSLGAFKNNYFWGGYADVLFGI